MTIKQKNIITWIFKLIAAVILLQTLFFKFTAAPESVFIFSRLGMEPWGRIIIGVLELIASILLLIPGTTLFGAFLGLGLMGGALFFHLTKLGIVVQDDSGQLFIYALLVFISCFSLALLNKERMITLFSRKKI